MRRAPFDFWRSATLALIVANTVAFLAELFYYRGGFPRNDLFALSWWGLSHGYLWQLVTFQFLHGGLLHLLFNCIAIFFFGRELEAVLGVRRFLILYFSSGVLGGLAQAAFGGIAIHFFPDSPWWLRFAGPTVGASAGAFGLLAAFAVLYPERQLIMLLFYVIPVTMRAKFLLVLSGIVAVIGFLLPSGHIADAAHLGGMVTGICFIRYALDWQWQWPRFPRASRSASRRLVKVSSASSHPWGSKPAVEEELPPEDFVSKQVDPILDKISAHGIQSLTEQERRILEAAREKMARR